MHAYKVLVSGIIVALLWLGFQAGDADAALYERAGVQPRPKWISVCFVDDAVTNTATSSRVQQILTFIKHFERAANIRFNYIGKCPAPRLLDNGNEYYDGDIRVLIPNVTTERNVSPVPGKGCTDKGAPDSSWSHFPNMLEANRSCRFNMFLGDDGDAIGPYLNHTLHEFGHALGLSHEHERFDVERQCGMTYLLQIPGITVTDTGSIFDAGFRNVSQIKSAEIAALQKIKGFETVARATWLRQQARTVARPADYGGGAREMYITPYDRLSVMHYKFAGCGINGNYAHTGLSDYDRLALHILYPEDGRVAELVGATVIRAGSPLKLMTAWEARGATINVAARGFQWKLNSLIASQQPRLDITLTNPGVYPLELRYQDNLGLGHQYVYTGAVRVLSPADYDRKIVAPMAARLPLLSP